MAERRIHVRQNPGNEATDASQSRGRGNIQPSQSGQFDTGVDVPAILEGPTKPVREAIDISRPPPSSSPSASICRQRQRHPRTGMETASIQPSRDDDVARVPASIFVFPPDRFLGAACHGARRGVNGPRDPCGAPRVPLTPRRAPRQRAVVTNRKGKRR